MGLVSILLAVATTYMVVEQPTLSQSSSSSGGGGPSGAGGGGGAITARAIIVPPVSTSVPSVLKQSNPSCLSNWVCSGWSSCDGELQTRQCYDENKCQSNKPLEYAYCGMGIAPPSPNAITGFLIANGGTANIIVGSFIILTMGSVGSLYVVRRARQFGWVRNKFAFSAFEHPPKEL